MGSENDNSNNGLIQQLLNFVPKKLQAVAAILIIVITVIVIIKQNFPNLFENKKDNNCENISIIGKVVDSKTREPIKIKKITIEGFNLNPDLNSSEGVFTFFGVKLPNHKIIFLEITTQNGKNYITQRYDISNESKYPINNCKVDIGTIPLDIISENNYKKSIKKYVLTKKQDTKPSFTINNQLDRNVINYFESTLDMNYELINPKYNITFAETGKIQPVNQEKTQFMYSGGELLIKINDVECGKIPNAYIDRTLPSGNDYYYVKNEVEKQINEIILSQKYFISKFIRKCVE